MSITYVNGQRVVIESKLAQPFEHLRKKANRTKRAQRIEAPNGMHIVIRPSGA